jgi:DNA-binding transcriptional MerR regulator
LNKAPDAFRTISEVAGELDLPQHVLRFWESRFPHIKPLKRGGGRRYYRPEDIDLLRGIRRLLYSDGYTIKGVQRILREQGVRTVQSVGQGLEIPDLGQHPAGQDDAHDGEDGHNGAPPQNGPIADADSAAAEAITQLESGQVEQAPIAPNQGFLNPAVANQVTFGQVAVATPAAIRMASPPNMTAQDLDRLKRALSELEACRRLLDRAMEGDGETTSSAGEVAAAGRPYWGRKA